MQKKSLHNFLHLTAQRISTSVDYNPLDTLIILPTRRSARHFSDHLKSALERESLLMPEVLTLTEWIFSNSSLHVADKDVLLLELFRVYQSVWPEPLELDAFMRWGQMMLSDFDEIDKYCVNARQLFSVISDEKELEQQFSIEGDLKEWLGEFWGKVNEEKGFEKDFIQTWRILGEVYTLFKQNLQEKCMAYEGMACLEVLEGLQNRTLVLPYKEIHFVGFNAFSVFEERMVEVLSLQYNVSLHWDADSYFLDNEHHEAGNFLRNYKSSFPAANHHWNVGDQLSNGRKFHFHSAPLAQGQASAVASLLERPFDGSTVVVLCDDSLQEPTVHAIAYSDSINLTMGRKIGDGPMSELMYVLFRLSISNRISKKEVERLALHPYLHWLLGSDKAARLSEWLVRYPSFYLPQKDLAEQMGELGKHLRQAAHIDDVTQLWLKALERILFNADKDDLLLRAIVIAYKTAILEQGQRLAPYISDISLQSAYHLLRAVVRNVSLPYDTSEDADIQVMGFLETRLLDFDRVIIVGANEDMLPAGKWGSSYIPFHLRKAFNLPTLQEYDGVYAYHFFRLLQRSKEAHFIYNSVQGDIPFERSRFLEQIALELDTPGNRLYNHSWDYKTASTKIPSQQIIVPKKEEHVELLKERRFSQTALSLYLTCPLQFYLQYIEGIAEPEGFEENLDAGEFGSILHRAIELLYNDLIDVELTPEILKQKKPLVDQCLKQAFDEARIPFETLSGENLLAGDVIREGINRLIDLDIQSLAGKPFFIRHLEGSFERVLVSERFGEIRFKGKIDRLDEVVHTDGLMLPRVLDYKTGKVDLSKGKEVNQKLMDDLFIRMQTKLPAQVFQGMFYLFLLNSDEATAGFYSLRKLSQGMIMLHQGKSVGSESIRLFEEKLIDLVEEILDPELPFMQNPNGKAYEYSPYSFAAP